MSFHSETEGTPSKDEHYYEEDFEEDSESNKQTTPTYSNIRKVPCEIENVMSRSPSLLDSPVKARNYLCKLSTENIELRNRLKNLNSKLNEVLEITKKKVRARSTSTHREKVKSQQVTTMDKQINNYQSE